MKTLLVTVALALMAVPCGAAIQYDFIQKNTSPDPVLPVAELTARAVVDGDRSRIDFLSGNLYPPGTYVVSTDGSRSLRFVDPVKEWYTEVDTASLATTLGTSSIRISNIKSDVKTFDDRPMIAGHATVHTQLTLSYEISVIVKSIPLKQRVKTEVDTWATSAFPATSAASFLSGLRTGNPEIDKLLEVQSTRIQGFPLRQTVTTHAMVDLPPSRSELNTPTARTIIREMWVTAIRETPPDAAMFAIPAKYRRANVEDVPRSTSEVLTFDPPTQP